MTDKVLTANRLSDGISVWLDAAGNGEWGIALRGAVIESPHTVRLYAGCGVVDGSVPETELAETWAKFRPMLESLGISS